MGRRTQTIPSCFPDIFCYFDKFVYFFFINNIYCNICSKSLKGSSRELTLLTVEYFKNTNARQDRTHT